MTRTSLMKGAVTIAAMQLILLNIASASQGPGVPAGTASAFTQTAMAVVVYGFGAMMLVASLISVLRKN